jgi:hypothetical protein
MPPMPPMAPCPNEWCPWVSSVAGLFLVAAWFVWAPYVLRYRAIPQLWRLVALVLLAAFLVILVVVMPITCGPCEVL